MKKTIYFNENTIVAFHIGRGGRFHNAGHLSFVGEHNIDYFADDLFSPVMPDPEDEEDFIDNDDPQAEYLDECGNGTGLTNEMVTSGVGRIDRDGEYDTVYTMYLGEVEEDSKEFEAIFNEDGFDAEQAQMFLRKKFNIGTEDED